MPITYDEVRRLALTFPGVAEGRAYGGPSLHVGRKFLGRLQEDGETFVVKITRGGIESWKVRPMHSFLPITIGHIPMSWSICSQLVRRHWAG